MKNELKYENIVDEKFSEDDQKITESLMKQEKIPLEPIELPQSSPYEIRDTYYSQVLLNYNQEYVLRRKQIKWMRNVMFVSMISILIAVVIASIVLFLIIIARGVDTLESLLSLITVCVSFVSTILTIPIIIAKR